MTLMRNALQLAKRSFSAAAAAAPERKVVVVGAAGGIGQPLGLLMKLNPLVSQLSLYDVVGTPGVAADISHVCTRSSVRLASSIIRSATAMGGMREAKSAGSQRAEAGSP